MALIRPKAAQINFDVTNISDPTIRINAEKTGANDTDVGFIFERGSTGDNAVILWDESVDKFVLGTTTATGATGGDLTTTSGSLLANIEGTLNGLTYPSSDGTNGQVLVTNGSGTLSFSDGGGGGGISDVVEDTTPQLGGNLDGQAFNITTTGTVTAGGLTVDTDTLYVDATNNRVGIGTTAPSASLHAYKASGTTQITAQSAGSTGSDVATVLSYAGSYTNQQTVYGTGTAYNSTNASAHIIGVTSGSGTVRIYSGGAEAIRIDSSGNVGIGTASPSSPLTVAGVIESTSGGVKFPDGTTQTSAGYSTADINTYIDRGYVTSENASNLADGWYTIATNTGNRAIAEFAIWDTASGDHQHVLFNATHSYGATDSNSINVFANSAYSGSNFRYIRIKEGGTYEGAALQVYIEGSTNAVNAAIVGANVTVNGWVLKDWIPDATDPGDVDNWGTMAEAVKVDLDNISAGGILTSGTLYATSATVTGTVTANLFDGTATSARYADLAENYVADAQYEPGTVLIFGGQHEVTASRQPNSNKIAGVVSTAPGVLMNKDCEGEFIVALAFTGRVPTKVKGTISKGDMMVSSNIEGVAVASDNPAIGTVIGKALESYDSEEVGVIEVVVGRL